MFGHEKFTAYQYSIKFVALATQLIERFPKGNTYLVDQLKRAAISIPLNIAEGSGKNSNKDKQRFYSIARGEAMECAAILDVLCSTNIFDLVDIKEHKELLGQIAAILSKVCVGY